MASTGSKAPSAGHLVLLANAIRKEEKEPRKAQCRVVPRTYDDRSAITM